MAREVFLVLVIAHEWAKLTVIAATPLVRPETSTGAELLLPEPCPSRPKSLLPQHLTPPPGVIAHVCRSPAATAIAVPADARDVGLDVGAAEAGAEVAEGVATGAEGARLAGAGEAATGPATSGTALGCRTPKQKLQYPQIP